MHVYCNYIREQQKEFENQLQADLANRDADNAVLDKKYRVLQVKMDDLNKTVAQFRALTVTLQAQLERSASQKENAGAQRSLAVTPFILFIIY